MYGLINTFIRIFCLVFVVITSVSSAYADIYMYIDSKGILHFTNIPTSSPFKLYIREKPAGSLQTYLTDRYDYFIAEASKKHGVSFPLLKAMIKVESNFNPQAVSRAGAMGLMQIMPENLKALKIVNPFDPLENIMGGTLYFKKLLKRYDGKLPLALAAYNAGPGRVDRYKKIPPIKETKNYVKNVMEHYYVLKKGYR